MVVLLAVVVSYCRHVVVALLLFVLSLRLLPSSLCGHCVTKHLLLRAHSRAWRVCVVVAFARGCYVSLRVLFVGSRCGCCVVVMYV